MNNIICGPHVVQYSSRRKGLMKPAFLGKNMKNKYQNKINMALSRVIIPEFGQFEPVNITLDEENKNRFTLTIKPAEDTDVSKNVVFAYANSNTGRLIFKSKAFKDKSETESFLKNLSNEDIDRIKAELKRGTEA